MKLFFYDTETTGLPDYRAPSSSDHQPHIVQAAGALVDLETRQVEAAFDMIVKPDGWTIPVEIAAIHGITTERALDCGISERSVVEVIVEFWRACQQRIGHNQSFDARIVRIGLKRFGFGDDLADQWKAGASACTALLASPICNLPATEAQRNNSNFKRKTPTLQEAYKHFFGTEYEGAHGALPDVDACMKVYWAIQGGASC